MAVLVIEGDARFWSELEFRVCREFDSVEEWRRSGLWCDGFIARGLDVEQRPNRIHGQVWIGTAPRGQERWEFELLLPGPVASMAELDWSELLPPEDEHGWLGVDREGQFLLVDRSRDDTDSGSEAND